MDGELVLTLLSENTVRRLGLRGEHGFSVFLKKNGFRVLFDTGQSGLFLDNARILNVPVSKSDAIFLSHGHYDHTGGLLPLMERNSAPVYGHPDIFMERFADPGPGREPRNIGMPFPQSTFENRGMMERFTLSKDPCEVEGFHLTGYVPRTTSFEDMGRFFFRDRSLKTPDDIPDDQSLFIQTGPGLVVVLGCCHSGLINTLGRIGTLTGNAHIHWIIGGTHLVAADDERLDETARALDKIGFDRISPVHCTGFRAQSYLFERYGDRYVPLECGNTVRVPL